MEPPKARCGCYFLYYGAGPDDPPARACLPVVDIETQTRILNNTSRTTLRQNFRNSSIINIDRCTYTFPLYDGVSVVGFTCKVQDRIITGIVKERSESKKTFDEAVKRNELAGLLAQSRDAGDVFSASIGNLPAGATVEVEISYVGELQHDAQLDGIRFTIPTSIAPRYGYSSMGQVLPTFSEVDSKTMRITVDIDMADGSPITNISSPSHPISVKMGALSSESGSGYVPTKASATLSLGQTTLRKDFVLIVKAEDAEAPKAVIETHSKLPGYRAIMATLVPRFALPPIRPEIVFVVDRSGSMSENIEVVTAAMAVFLKSLTPGTKFNICSFGNQYSFLWHNSKTYDRESLCQAEAHIRNFRADMGGTETLQAIKATIEKRYDDIPLEIILLTDGMIHAQNAAFEYVSREVEKSKGQIRLFPLGIGSRVSSSLVQGLARAGNGFAQSVQNGENLDKRLMRMLKGAISPHITNYTLEVQYGDQDDFEMIERTNDAVKVSMGEQPGKSEDSDGQGESKLKEPISLFDPFADPDANNEILSTAPLAPKLSEPALLQAPAEIPSLYAFQRTSVYLILSPEAIQKNPVAVVVRGSSDQSPLELRIPIERLPGKDITIHALAARKAAQELEEGRGWVYEARDGESQELIRNKYASCFEDMAEAEAIRLGTTFQIANRFCSFVAVEARPRVEVEEMTQGFFPSKQDLDTESGSNESTGFSSFILYGRPKGSLPVHPAANALLHPVKGSGGLRKVRSGGGDGKDPKVMGLTAGPEPSDESDSTRRFNSTDNITPIHYGAKGWAPPRHSLDRSQRYSGPLMCGIYGSSTGTVTRETAASKARRLSAPFPTSVPPRETPSPAVTRVRALIHSQDFDGWWALGGITMALIGIDRNTASAAKGNLTDQVWATVLVIRFLESSMAVHREVWEMIVEKAKVWLVGQGIEYKTQEQNAQKILGV